MYNYIYELLQAPTSADEWTSEWELSERPEAFPVASRIGTVEDRAAVIARFGAWLEKHRLGMLTCEAFVINAQAANRYFEGRFAAFQQAMIALQQLDEAQFIHDHDRVQGLIHDLAESFTQKYGDYVLWGDSLEPTPLEEFLRKAQPGEQYYIGAVLSYKH